MGAMSGAIGANDFPRQSDGSGRAAGDHASSRTDPDDTERLTGIYGSEGWGFESLRARPVVSQDIGMTPNPQLGFGVLGFAGRAGCSGWGAWWASGGLVVLAGVEGEFA